MIKVDDLITLNKIFGVENGPFHRPSILFRFDSFFQYVCTFIADLQKLFLTIFIYFYDSQKCFQFVFHQKERRDLHFFRFWFSLFNSKFQAYREIHIHHKQNSQESAFCSITMAKFQFYTLEYKRQDCLQNAPTKYDILSFKCILSFSA